MRPHELARTFRLKPRSDGFVSNWVRSVRRDPSTPDLALESTLTVPLGWLEALAGRQGGHDVGISWRVDAVIASRPARPTDPFPTREDGRQLHPALLLRPCSDFAIDMSALGAAYEGWLRSVDRRRPPDVHDLGAGVPPLDHVVPAPPPRYPPRRPPPLDLASDAYARNALAVLDDVERAAGAESADPGRLWMDHLFLAEHALCQPEAPGELLSAGDRRLGVLERLPPRERRGNARRQSLPSLAGALFSALPDGRKTGRFVNTRRHILTSVIGPLSARFAYELAVARELRQALPHVATVREAFAWDRPKDEARAVRLRAAAALRGETRRRVYRLSGRGGETDRASLVRRVVPYLIADTALLARPISTEFLANRPCSAGKEPFRVTADLLYEWLRGDSFVVTLALVCARRPDRLRFLATAGETWERFRVERLGALHVFRVRVATDSPRFRTAVAAIPEARLDQPIDVWLAGYGSHAEAVRDRLIGPGAGEIEDGFTLHPPAVRVRARPA